MPSAAPEHVIGYVPTLTCAGTTVQDGAVAVAVSPPVRPEYENVNAGSGEPNGLDWLSAVTVTAAGVTVNVPATYEIV